MLAPGDWPLGGHGPSAPSLGPLLSASISVYGPPTDACGLTLAPLYSAGRASLQNHSFLSKCLDASGYEVLG